MKKQGKMRDLRRGRVMIGLFCSVVFLTLILIGGMACAEQAVATDFTEKNIPPCPAHLFGTDWMGRDMFARTLSGLSISIGLGVLSASISAGIALVLGIAAATLGRKTDAVITFLIDLVMGIPHILLLILITVAFGKGFRGVAVGIALTHWPTLTRIVRAEVLQLRERPYIQIAEKLGKSKWYLIRRHMIPHVLPQFFVGLVLLFPHAVLHESSITFLGFGLSSKKPAIGIILAESMRYLITGQWWLAVFPGVLLTCVSGLFYVAGQSLRKLTDPGSIHE